MRRLIPLLPILAALAAPAGASASSGQVTTFEAPRELLSAATRDATLSRITSLGVSNVRQLVYWRDYAPSPASATTPDFDASNPDAYPPGTWGNLDALIAAAKQHGVTVMLTLTGPPPRWATRDSKLSYPDAKAFGAFTTAIGKRYGASVDTWSIWNEPNQPQFLLPQYVRGKPESPKIYRGLYRAAYAGLRKSNPKDAILIGETSPRGNSHIVAPLAFLRGMLCLDSHYRKSKSCGGLQASGYAHHAYTTAAGPHFKPKSSDDVTIGVLGRLVTPLNPPSRAHPGERGRGAAKGPADPPDRVRDPVRARQDLRRLAVRAGRLPRGRRAHGLREPARRAVLAVPAHRRRAAHVGLQVRRLRERADLLHRQGEAGLPGLPPAARRRAVRRVGRAVGPRAPAARALVGDDPAQAQGQGLGRAQDARHDGDRRVRAQDHARIRPALPRPLDEPGRCDLHRAADPPVLTAPAIGVQTRYPAASRKPIQVACESGGHDGAFWARRCATAPACRSGSSWTPTRSTAARSSSSSCA